MAAFTRIELFSSEGEGKLIIQPAPGKDALEVYIAGIYNKYESEPLYINKEEAKELINILEFIINKK